jgi:hypothetical protein
MLFFTMNTYLSPSLRMTEFKKGRFWPRRELCSEAARPSAFPSATWERENEKN